MTVCADDEPGDLEVTFETKEQHSDMFYVLVLQNWKIIDLYGAD